MLWNCEMFSELAQIDKLQKEIEKKFRVRVEYTDRKDVWKATATVIEWKVNDSWWTDWVATGIGATRLEALQELELKMCFEPLRSLY